MKRSRRLVMHPTSGVSMLERCTGATMYEPLGGRCSAPSIDRRQKMRAKTSIAPRQKR